MYYLCNGRVKMDLEEKIEKIAQWIAKTERVVVFTGAGISTESGLPR